MAFFPRLLHRAARIYWRVARPTTVGVKVLLVRDGEVALVRHTYQDLWFLPGGGVKKGETFEEAARRELHEEVGAQLGELRLLGVYSSFTEAKSDHIAVFVSSPSSIEGARSWEIEECRFFPTESLPPDCGSGDRRRIAEYLGGEWPHFGKW
jgi:ADP-ribose pyrophosphatase YjhB (NUDIX family)